MRIQRLRYTEIVSGDVKTSVSGILKVDWGGFLDGIDFVHDSFLELEEAKAVVKELRDAASLIEAELE